MSLKEQIQKDMIEAMKAKDEVKVGALRMLKSAVLKFETSGDRKVAEDGDVLAVIGKEVKQRKDAADQFKAGGREDLAEKEEKEAAVLQVYLPAQLSEAEIETLVKEAIAATGATSKKDMGKVMGALMPKVKGKADGGIVNKVVGKLLP